MCEASVTNCEKLLVTITAIAFSAIKVGREWK